LPGGTGENHDNSFRIVSMSAKISNWLSNTCPERYHYSSLFNLLVRGSLRLQQTARRPATKNSNLLVASSCNWICCYPLGLRCGNIVKGSMQPAIQNTLTREAASLWGFPGTTKQTHCISPSRPALRDWPGFGKSGAACVEPVPRGARGSMSRGNDGRMCRWFQHTPETDVSKGGTATSTQRM
jgi:hypothetical protein